MNLDKVQQAINQDYENKKTEIRMLSKENQEIQEEMKFSKRQEKKLQKKGDIKWKSIRKQKEA